MLGGCEWVVCVCVCVCERKIFNIMGPIFVFGAFQFGAMRVLGFFSALVQVTIFVPQHKPGCTEMGGTVQQGVCKQIYTRTVAFWCNL